MTPAELLEAVKAHLTPDTWGQCSYGPYSAGHDGGLECLDTALLNIAGTHGLVGSDDEHVAHDALVDVIAEQYADRLTPGFTTIWVMNDHRDTTLADVHAVCEKAAVACGALLDVPLEDLAVGE